MQTARERVAQLIGCKPEELVFTSSGTESNNWAIWGSVTNARKAGAARPHVVTTEMEHPTVLGYLKALADQVWKAKIIWKICLVFVTALSHIDFIS